MKKYLDIWMTLKSGQCIHNPLKLSEAHLISQMAQDRDVEKIEAKLAFTDKAGYELIFG